MVQDHRPVNELKLHRQLLISNLTAADTHPGGIVQPNPQGKARLRPPVHAL